MPVEQRARAVRRRVPTVQPPPETVASDNGVAGELLLSSSGAVLGRGGLLAEAADVPPVAGARGEASAVDRGEGAHGARRVVGARRRDGHRVEVVRHAAARVVLAVEGHLERDGRCRDGRRVALHRRARHVVDGAGRDERVVEQVVLHRAEALREAAPRVRAAAEVGAVDRHQRVAEDRAAVDVEVRHGGRRQVLELDRVGCVRVVVHRHLDRHGRREEVGAGAHPDVVDEVRVEGQPGARAEAKLPAGVGRQVARQVGDEGGAVEQHREPRRRVAHLEPHEAARAAQRAAEQDLAQVLAVVLDEQRRVGGDEGEPQPVARAKLAKRRVGQRPEAEREAHPGAVVLAEDQRVAAANVHVGREREPRDVEVARAQVPHERARLEVVRAGELQEARAHARAPQQRAAVRVRGAVKVDAPHAAGIRAAGAVALAVVLTGDVVRKVEAHLARPLGRRRRRRDAQQRGVVEELRVRLARAKLALDRVRVREVDEVGARDGHDGAAEAGARVGAEAQHVVRLEEREVGARVGVLLAVERDGHRERAAQVGQRREALQQRVVEVHRRDVGHGHAVRQQRETRRDRPVAEAAAVVGAEIEVAAHRRDDRLDVRGARNRHQARDGHGPVVVERDAVVRVLLAVLRHLDGQRAVEARRVGRDAVHVAGVKVEARRHDELGQILHGAVLVAVLAAVVGAVAEMDAGDGHVGEAGERARRRAELVEHRRAVEAPAHRVDGEVGELLAVERELEVIVDGGDPIDGGRDAPHHGRHGRLVGRREDDVLDVVAAPAAAVVGARDEVVARDGDERVAVERAGRGAQLRHGRQHVVLELEVVVGVLLPVEAHLHRHRDAAEGDLAVGGAARDAAVGGVVEGLGVQQRRAHLRHQPEPAAVQRAVDKVLAGDRDGRGALDRAGARRDDRHLRRQVVHVGLAVGVVLPVGREAQAHLARVGRRAAKVERAGRGAVDDRVVDEQAERVAPSKVAVEDRARVGAERVELDEHRRAAVGGARRRIEPAQQLRAIVLERHRVGGELLVVDRHLDGDDDVGRVLDVGRVEHRRLALEVVAVALVAKQVADHLGVAKLAAVGVATAKVGPVDEDGGAAHLGAEVGVDERDVVRLLVREPHGVGRVLLVVERNREVDEIVVDELGRLRRVALERARAEHLRVDDEAAEAALVVVAVGEVDARHEEVRAAVDGPGAGQQARDGGRRQVGHVQPDAVEGLPVLREGERVDDWRVDEPRARDAQVVDPVVVAPPVRARAQPELPAALWRVAGQPDARGGGAAVLAVLPVAAPAAPAVVGDREAVGGAVADLDARPGGGAQHVRVQLPQPDERGAARHVGAKRRRGALIVVLDAQVVGRRHKRHHQPAEAGALRHAVRRQPAVLVEQRLVGHVAVREREAVAAGAAADEELEAHLPVVQLLLRRRKVRAHPAGLLDGVHRRPRVGVGRVERGHHVVGQLEHAALDARASLEEQRGRRRVEPRVERHPVRRGTQRVDARRDARDLVAAAVVGLHDGVLAEAAAQRPAVEEARPLERHDRAAVDGRRARLHVDHRVVAVGGLPLDRPNQRRHRRRWARLGARARADAVLGHVGRVDRVLGVVEEDHAVGRVLLRVERHLDRRVQQVGAWQRLAQQVAGGRVVRGGDDAGLHKVAAQVAPGGEAAAAHRHDQVARGLARERPDVRDHWHGGVRPRQRVGRVLLAVEAHLERADAGARVQVRGVGRYAPEAVAAAAARVDEQPIVAQPVAAGAAEWLGVDEAVAKVAQPMAAGDAAAARGEARARDGDEGAADLRAARRRDLHQRRVRVEGEVAVRRRRVLLRVEGGAQRHVARRGRRRHKLDPADRDRRRRLERAVVGAVPVEQHAVVGAVGVAGAREAHDRRAELGAGGGARLARQRRRVVGVRHVARAEVLPVERDVDEGVVCRGAGHDRRRRVAVQTVVVGDHRRVDDRRVAEARVAAAEAAEEVRAKRHVGVEHLHPDVRAAVEGAARRREARGERRDDGHLVHAVREARRAELLPVERHLDDVRRGGQRRDAAPQLVRGRGAEGRLDEGGAEAAAVDGAAAEVGAAERHERRAGDGACVGAQLVQLRVGKVAEDEPARELLRIEPDTHVDDGAGVASRVHRRRRAQQHVAHLAHPHRRAGHAHRVDVVVGPRGVHGGVAQRDAVVRAAAQRHAREREVGASEDGAGARLDARGERHGAVREAHHVAREVLRVGRHLERHLVQVVELGRDEAQRRDLLTRRRRAVARAEGDAPVRLGLPRG